MDLKPTPAATSELVHLAEKWDTALTKAVDKTTPSDRSELSSSSGIPFDGALRDKFVSSILVGMNIEELGAYNTSSFESLDRFLTGVSDRVTNRSQTISVATNPTVRGILSSQQTSDQVILQRGAAMVLAFFGGDASSNMSVEVAMNSLRACVVGGSRTSGPGEQQLSPRRAYILDMLRVSPSLADAVKATFS